MRLARGASGGLGSRPKKPQPASWGFTVSASVSPKDGLLYRDFWAVVKQKNPIAPEKRDGAGGTGIGAEATTNQAIITRPRLLVKWIFC